MAACAAYSFNVSQDSSLISALNSALVGLFNGTLGQDIVPSIQSSYCGLVSSGDVNGCFGIRGNADITGTGIRISNYMQVILNALVIWKSPHDSNLTSWGATLLTAAAVIPAMVQKSQSSLSVYHATQVLNFATISTLSNLATAPMCEIWRPKIGRGSPAETQFDGDAGFAMEGEVLPNNDANERLLQLQQVRPYTSRITLSLALLAQVCLQWGWAVYMFLVPDYFQTPCSGGTVVIIFGHPFTVHFVNHHAYVVFPLWILCHLFVTFLWGSLLVFLSSSEVHPIFSPPASVLPSPVSLCRKSYRMRLHKLLTMLDKKRLFVLVMNSSAVMIALFLAVSSEMQLKLNCILLESTWGFGQVAAILLLLLPIGVFIAALSANGDSISGSQNHEQPNPRPHRANFSADWDNSQQSTSVQSPLLPLTPRSPYNDSSDIPLISLSSPYARKRRYSEYTLPPLMAATEEEELEEAEARGDLSEASPMMSEWDDPGLTPALSIMDYSDSNQDLSP